MSKKIETLKWEIELLTEKQQTMLLAGRGDYEFSNRLKEIRARLDYELDNQSDSVPSPLQTKPEPAF